MNNLKKKIISILLAMVMMVGVLGFLPPTGVDANVAHNAFDIAIDNLTVTTTGVHIVPVRVTRNAGVAHIQLIFNLCQHLTLRGFNRNNSAFPANADIRAFERTINVDSGDVVSSRRREMMQTGILFNLELELSPNTPTGHRCAININTSPSWTGPTTWARGEFGGNLTLSITNGGIFFNPPLPPPATNAPRVILRDRTTARIAWNSVERATEYRIYRRQGTGDWIRIGVNQGQTNIRFTDRNLALGRRFEYRIVAVNRIGGQALAAPYSRTRRLATFRPATRSRVPSLTGGNGRFTVRRVGSIVGAERYQIQYRRSGTRRWISVNMGTRRQRNITGRRSGATYQVRIRAIRRINGNRTTLRGRWSPVATVRVR